MIYDISIFRYNDSMENFFRSIIELNETEKYLKRIYLSPLPSEPAEKILEKVFADNPPEAIGQYISEQALITDDLDCSFIRHMRYLPEYWHQHEFFEMMYVLHGSCENIYKTHTIHMAAGNICISAPSSIHTVTATSDDAILLNILIRKSTFEHTFLSIMEEDEILSAFFKRSLYAVDEIPYLYFPIRPDEELISIMEKAYKEFSENHRFKKDLLNAYLSNFFILLLRKHEQSLLVPAFYNNESSENIIYILRYLQEHFSDVSLKEMSDFFNYSERQLQRIIEKATGMTFTENIQKQRMKKAQNLLESTDLPIEKIGESIGYASPNNFRRIFSSHFGMTPKDYRKSKKK